MSEFSVIPVLDLKDGNVVHAVGGKRADYRPIASPFGSADDPLAIARGLLHTAGARTLYIADLDAIAGRGNNFELCRALADRLHGVTLWIDAGFSDVTDCLFWLPLGATLVIGSESLASLDPWEEIRASFGKSAMLSLDFEGESFRGPAPLFADAERWPEQLIVISLARVGTGTGPDLERLGVVCERAGDRSVILGGGVRDAADLAEVAQSGACGALIATALHTGAITQKEIAALA